MLRANLDTNTISDTPPSCHRLQNGTINCSSMIYHDRKTWRRSRHQIDNEIQKLKEKLSSLKEIKKHLKQSKPKEHEDDVHNKEPNLTLTIFNDNINVTDVPPEITSSSISSSSGSTMFANRSQRKRKKYTNPDEISRQNKRQKIKNDNFTDLIDIGNVTDWFNFNITDDGTTVTYTKEPSTEFTKFSNHHRHNHSHRHHHTTTMKPTSYFDKSYLNHSTRKHNSRTQTTAATTAATTNSVPTTTTMSLPKTSQKVIMRKGCFL